MGVLVRVISASVLGGLLISGGVGQLKGQGPPQLAGLWDVQMTVKLSQPPAGAQTVAGEFVPITCRFEGSANVTQNDGRLMGSSSQTLVAGPAPPCEQNMNATLNGKVNGGISGTMDGGQQFGTASFQQNATGGKSLAGAVSLDQSPSGPAPVSGTLAVTGGRFAGATGTWNAQLQLGPASEIPAVSGLGLALLVALLLGSSLLLMRRTAV